MKVEMLKQAGGIFTPANDTEAEKMTRFKTGLTYPVEIKHQRNQKFHGKVFSFFTYCYEYWEETSAVNVINSAKQFDSMRKQLTISAGYYHQVFTLDGRGFELVADSLAFGNMSQEDFESCYTALIQAATNTIFKDVDDEFYYNKLAGFF